MLTIAFLTLYRVANGGWRELEQWLAGVVGLALLDVGLMVWWWSR